MNLSENKGRQQLPYDNPRGAIAVQYSKNKSYTKEIGLIKYRLGIGISIYIYFVKLSSNR